MYTVVNMSIPWCGLYGAHGLVEIYGVDMRSNGDKFASFITRRFVSVVRIDGVREFISGKTGDQGDQKFPR